MFCRGSVYVTTSAFSNELNAVANTAVATSAQCLCNCHETMEKIRMYNVRFANPDFDNYIENVYLGLCVVIVKTTGSGTY